MSDMTLDRVAKAYMNGRYCSFEGWKNEQERDDCILGIRAILTALRSPTEGMIDAAVKVGRSKTVGEGIVAEWQAQIDYLLNEEQ